MSTLLLVRHGQASFGARNYDALSSLGHRQSRVLGQALAARGVLPDVVLRGTMRRHDETAAGLLEGLGTAVPVEVDDGWDEFDFQHVVEVHKPRYRNRTVMVADLARTGKPVQAFQEVFEAATDRWTGGEHDADYAESFPAFRSRVEQGLRRAHERLATAATVLVVSSGGPIGLATTLLVTGRTGGDVDSFDDRHVAALWAAYNRVAVNTGVTKVIGGRRGLTLSSTNEHTHLEADRRLLTYR